MTDNLRHWNALSKTDPRHTKTFQRAGGFRGTATKPIWVSMRLTEHFGPFGVAWGCDEPKFELVTAGDEILVFCTLACWYIDNERRATVYGIGGDKVAAKRKDGGLFTDDEAYKKAFTDALGNAFKNVGSGADVHMGLFDDSKYVAAMKEEFVDDNSATPSRGDVERPAAPPPSPGVAGRLSAEALIGRLPKINTVAGLKTFAATHEKDIDALSPDDQDMLRQRWADRLKVVKSAADADHNIIAAG